MKKPRRRVHSESEITDKIDRLRALIVDRKRRADKLEAEASELWKKWNDEWGDGTQYDLNHHQVRAKAMAKAASLRQKAIRLRHMEPATLRRLSNLKQKLAEMRTQILPGIVPDGSINL